MRDVLAVKPDTCGPWQTVEMKLVIARHGRILAVAARGGELEFRQVARLPVAQAGALKRSALIVVAQPVVFIERGLAGARLVRKFGRK